MECRGGRLCRAKAHESSPLPAPPPDIPTRAPVCLQVGWSPSALPRVAESLAAPVPVHSQPPPFPDPSPRTCAPHGRGPRHRQSPPARLRCQETRRPPPHGSKPPSGSGAPTQTPISSGTKIPGPGGLSSNRPPATCPLGAITSPPCASVSSPTEQGDINPHLVGSLQGLNEIIPRGAEKGASGNVRVASVRCCCCCYIIALDAGPPWPSHVSPATCAPWFFLRNACSPTPGSGAPTPPQVRSQTGLQAAIRGPCVYTSALPPCPPPVTPLPAAPACPQTGLVSGLRSHLGPARGSWDPLCPLPHPSASLLPQT